jgi:hypothetical protein
MSRKQVREMEVDAETIVRTYIYSKLQDSISVNTVTEPFITVNGEEILFQQLDAALMSVFGVYHKSVETETPADEIIRAFAVQNLEEDRQYFDADDVIHTVNDKKLTHNDVDDAITTVFKQQPSNA